jgi:hypothetical protein
LLVKFESGGRDAADCALPPVGKNQANMFTVNSLRQTVNEPQAPIAQKLGSQFGSCSDICEFVPIVPADRRRSWSKSLAGAKIDVPSAKGCMDGGMMGIGGTSAEVSIMIMELFKGILNLQTPFNMIVLVVLFGCVTGVIKGIATQIRKYGCHRQDIDFKRELVDRGLSADEIERIIQARSSDGAALR